ncbi:hypothetical protein RJ639_033913 [Escallonia herrerae]|uniref:Cystathionine gamma-synthase n=1 Tax=Escallonia herrerae TaxID=1293975 RepID=A0AA89B8D7_9ASTE|nr:hypothetical protein RJ639_033913 [Escallonia herrerae]
MAVSSCPRVFPTFECRSDPDYAGTTRPEHPSSARFATAGKSRLGGLSSLILRFPPNFARQLSTKARRNCGNIGVAQATVVDPADVHALESALYKNQVTLFFTETPTNPFLRCVDIELVSKLCHSKGALVCVDGTFATPLNQKALALGADIVLHSATKYIAGHNDVLAGCISGSEKLIAPVRMLHNVLGGALNPNAAYLIIRGMKTLHLRIQQQNTTALKMARLLEAHPKVSRVYYSGLASHPEHYLAKRQMTGFGGVVSFEINGDLMTTAKFIDALKIPYIAPSFGGCESIVDQPAIMSYWDLSQLERAKFGIKDNLVRFSFGVEDFEDLKADILQALEAI